MHNSDLYKEASIQVDQSWLEEVLVGTASEDNNDENHDQNRIDEDDNFSEVDESEIPSGQLDTLLDQTDMAKILTFAPGEGQRPLSLYSDPDSEFIAFPSIYCCQRRAISSGRKVPVHYSDICKWELRSVDRRVALSVPHIFFKMKALQIKQVSDKVALSVRRVKSKDKKYTAGELLDGNKLESMVQLDEGFYIFRTLRNSPPYLEKRKKDVFVMIRQLGIPTWFISLSSADSRWTDLLRVLGKLVDQKTYSDDYINEMDWKEKTRLIQCDPVTCVRFFDQRVQTFINVILKGPHNPHGEIQEFFYRVEFQHRGSPHIHMPMWVKKAPEYDNEQNSDKEVTEFVDSHVSCDSNVSTEEKNLVDLQKHKHSRTCRKNGKAQCRFSYPQPPTSPSQILRPYEGEDEDK